MMWVCGDGAKDARLIVPMGCGFIWRAPGLGNGAVMISLGFVFY